MPSEAPSSPVGPPQPALTAVPTQATTTTLTRRQLLVLARERQLPRYSRLSTAQLHQALA